MKIKCDVISDKGLVRTNNEDMALLFGEQIRDSSFSITCDIPAEVRFTAIVADGMGGLANGEVASQMATTSFDQFLLQLPTGLDENAVIMKLKEWTRDIHKEIKNAAIAAGASMGTTLCGLFTYDGSVFVINIGDSRIYRWRYEFLKQLTTDHSERERLQDDSIPSNIIYNALGATDDAFIDVIPTKIISDDRFIICSDGLSDMVDDEILETIISSDNPTARACIDAAYNAGAHDNVTVILLEVINE